MPEPEHWRLVLHWHDGSTTEFTFTGKPQSTARTGGEGTVYAAADGDTVVEVLPGQVRAVEIKRLDA